jgi:DNA-binding Lrp family transcriptional regulator
VWTIATLIEKITAQTQEARDVPLDAADVRIFCEMAFRGLDYDSFTDRRLSPLAIGRKLGMDEKTVRIRVRRMEDDGFIKYYQALPNLSLFGLNTAVSYRFEALNLSTKHKVIENIRQAPFLEEAIDYLGHYVSISIAGQSAEQIEQLSAEMVNNFELSKEILGGRNSKKPLSMPDKLDWQIIQKLRYDAQASTKEISESLSVTPRMVDYRISKLLDSGLLRIRAIIDNQKQQGLIFYELEISIDDGKQFDVVKNLSNEYGERLWSIRTLASGNVLLANFFGFTLAEPEKAAAFVSRLEGVRSCSLFILKETIEPERPNWLDNLIAQNVVPSRLTSH